MFRFAFIAAVSLFATDLQAATVEAKPQSLAAAIKAGKAGDVIKLAKGEYGPVVMYDRKFAVPLTIDARDAVIKGIAFYGVSGVTWNGGAISSELPDGNGPTGYAVNIRNSDHISLSDAIISNSVRGITIAGSEHIMIARNNIQGMLVDGINIAVGSKFVTIDGNTCESLITGDRHPDCVQGWSRAGLPVSDITVINNVIRGKVQGVYFGNIPDRKGGGDPGFDRIVIENNRIDVWYPNGIVVTDCRECVIRFNTVTQIHLPGDTKPFRTKIGAFRGSGIVCGNKVPGLPDSPANAPCPKH
jgi:hypothetical protein